VQAVLIPREAPPIDGLEVAVRLRPARGISGDVYDFFEHGPGQAVIAFGDVSGKGAAAALYGAMVSGLLRTLAQRRKGAAELLAQLNRVLRERKVEAKYVSLLILSWDHIEQTFVMANAGSSPPILCRDGEIHKLKVEGVPAGLLDDRMYDELTLHTHPNDLLLLYSDGITDQLDSRQEEYGRNRLNNILKSVCKQSAEQIVDAVLADLDAFSAGAPAFDDQTLIAIRVL
jgi:phosphoserine phosphatase RsbU/P